MDDLSNEQIEIKKKSNNKKSYTLIISDFYYLNSAENLKNELIQKTQISEFLVEKISDNKYRLSLGPFENFNALKSIYISLNNLGFEDLKIYTKWNEIL